MGLTKRGVIGRDWVGMMSFGGVLAFSVQISLILYTFHE